MKKYIALALAALMLLCALTGCKKEEALPNAETTADFQNVGERYRDAVRHTFAKGLLTADEANCLNPQQVLTRAEAENLLYRMVGAETVSQSADASVGGLVLAQMAMQVTGSEGDNFVGSILSYNTNLTEEPVTREQAAQLLHNYMTYQEAMAAGMEKTALSFANGQNVKLLGRAEITADGVLTNFPGDGVEFTLECAGPMAVQFTVGYKANFVAEIDGVATFDKGLAASSTVLAGMIPAGKHTVRIVQDSEISTAGENNIIRGVDVLCKADTLAPTAEKDLYIEFVGDSLTAGQGNLGDPKTAWTFDTHSGTHAYSYMTAKKLDADYAIIAKGGIGAYMCSSSLWKNAPYLVGELYANQNVYRDQNAPATHGKADVVIINIGSNDREEDPDTQFETKFRELVRMVREGNPDADIVFVYNMFNARHMAFYGALAEELGGAEKGYYHVRLDRLINGVPSSKGGTPHPSAADNDKNSDKLVEFLKTLPSVQNRGK